MSFGPLPAKPGQRPTSRYATVKADSNGRNGQQALQRFAQSSRIVQHILDWQMMVFKHVTQQITLGPCHFVELVSFLGQLADWSQQLLETNLDLCVFCRNNNEPFETYSTHKVKDHLGRVTCPVLRQFICPVCGGTGDRAHTMRYCPHVVTHAAPTMSRRGSSTASSSRPSLVLTKAGLLDPTTFSG